LGYSGSGAHDYANYVRDRIKNGCTKFIITAAQNNTRIDAKAFATLKLMARYHDAVLIVVPVHYKNISLFTSQREYLKWWTRQVKPYIVDEAVYLGGNVEIQAHIKVQATAVNPLAGKEPIGGKRWSVFGHAQRSMRPVAAPATEIPKRLYTTGVITQKNYSRTDRGARAHFHHSCGALLVEVSGKQAFIRQLSASQGCLSCT
jgi:hypothetical protein